MAAGIARADARGRQVDIHALRHTFVTHLSASGTHPRTAMAAMRHSRIGLMMADGARMLRHDVADDTASG